MIGDLIVNLYEKDFWSIDKCAYRGERSIKKIFISDKERLIKFIQEEFPNEKGWVHEIERGVINSTVFIAVENSKIVGFAGYNCTGKGYFGPFGVSKEHRSKGYGRLLFDACMDALKADDYGYAILGWIADKNDDTNSPLQFYETVAHVSYIPNSNPQYTLYKRKTTFNKSLMIMLPSKSRSTKSNKKEKNTYKEFADSDIEKMIELKKSMTYKQIAEIYDTCDRNIYQHIKKYRPELIKTGVFSNSNRAKNTNF